MKKRLDQLIYERKLTSSRNQAAALIMSGRVKVEGKLATKAGFSVNVTANIEIAAGRRYVSRAGLKLESVAAKLAINFMDRTVLDIGSSTGGFTDFALQHGAKKVYAVDVGSNQLDYRLRQDPKVVVMEKTDIRSVQTLPEPIDIAVADVSFISLRMILPGIPQLMQTNGQIVAMVKPQFEADKKTADMYKGVIKNDTIRRRILQDFEQWAKGYFVIKAKADSEVSGAKGNLERFYLLKSLRGSYTKKHES